MPRISGTIQCCHILPSLKMNQLEESVTTLCRYVRQLAQFFYQVIVEKYENQSVF
jgi:hypothetical protein